MSYEPCMCGATDCEACYPGARAEAMAYAHEQEELAENFEDTVCEMLEQLRLFPDEEWRAFNTMFTAISNLAIENEWRFTIDELAKLRSER